MRRSRGEISYRDTGEDGYLETGEERAFLARKNIEYGVDRVIAIFRSLMETPEEICQVYGAERAGVESQRAAMNCHLWSGSETLGLVTVRQLGPSGLSVQFGDHQPVPYRFCRAIAPLLLPVSQQAER